MPRLSNALYLERHRFLRVAWLEFDHLYSVLPMRQQWDLHAFYVPDKDLSDEQLLEHRGEITEQRPSLPASSGRSFEILNDAFRRAFEWAEGDDLRFRQAVGNLSRQATTKSTGKRQIRIRVVVRPEIDLQKLARALLDHPAVLMEQHPSGADASPGPVDEVAGMPGV